MTDDTDRDVCEFSRPCAFVPPSPLSSSSQPDSVEVIQEQKPVIASSEEIWKSHCTKYPTTARFLDRLPSKPIEKIPHQRAVRNSRKNAMQMILYVTSHVALKEQQPKSRWERRGSFIGDQTKQVRQDDRLEHTMDKHDSLKRCDFAVSGTQPTYNQMKGRIFSTSVSLADFRPLRAPFVPDLIKQLVNRIEVHCYKTNWRKVYEPLLEYHGEATSRLINLLSTGNEKGYHLGRNLRGLDGPVAICMLRVFLGAFATKPLHFSTALVRELVQRPLYDHFLRPNPKLQGLVQCAAIPQSRTHLDTLAFLMVHLLHALDKNLDSLDGKMRLCNLYGPLLISFTERPQLCRSPQSNARTEEAALLDVILEVCDLHFWNHMSMLKIPAAFVCNSFRNQQSSTSDSLPSCVKEKQKLKKIWPENLDSSIISEILHNVQAFSATQSESDPVPSLDLHSRVLLPKRDYTSSPLSM